MSVSRAHCRHRRDPLLDPTQARLFPCLNPSGMAQGTGDIGRSRAIDTNIHLNRVSGSEPEMLAISEENAAQRIYFACHLFLHIYMNRW